MVSKKTGLQPNDFSFGIKLKFEKKPGVEYGSFYLTHTTDGHNKFYSMKILFPSTANDKITVVKEYGRIGQGVTGFKKVQNFQDTTEAIKFVQKKLAEQLKKGYKQTETK